MLAIIRVADRKGKICRTVVWVDVNDFGQGSDRLVLPLVLLLLQPEREPCLVVGWILLNGGFQLKDALHIISHAEDPLAHRDALRLTLSVGDSLPISASPDIAA